MLWFRRILLATDFSQHARAAEEYAAVLASAGQAQLEVLHVIEVLPGVYPYQLLNDMTLQQIRGEVDKHLAELVQRATKRGGTLTGRSVQGLPSEQIVAAAQRFGADMIVVGTKGRTGLEHVLLGSTAERVIKSAACPVLTIPSAQGPSDSTLLFQRIMVPVDFSDCSLDALEYSAQVSKACHAQVFIVHALDWISVGLNFSPMELAERNQMRDEMESRLARYADAFKVDGIPAEISLRGGPPVDSIIEYGEQQQCDLIIMGTHGRRGLSRVVFGSIAEGVLRQSQRPVLTVKSPTFAAGHRRILTESLRRPIATPSS